MNRSFFISVGPGQSVFAGEEFFFTGWSVGLRISGFFVTFVFEIKTA